MKYVQCYLKHTAQEMCGNQVSESDINGSKEMREQWKVQKKAVI
jgi:hypothetical protein